MKFLIQKLEKPEKPKDINDFDFCIRRERYIEQTILSYMEETYGQSLIYWYDRNRKINDSIPFLFRLDGNEYYKSVNTNNMWCINNHDVICRIENWLTQGVDFFPYLKRKTTVVTAHSLLNGFVNLQQFVNDKGQMFAKTPQKGWAYCCPVEEVIDAVQWLSVQKGGHSLIMISQPVDFEEEFRTFVINNNVVNTSVYGDYISKPIPDSVIKLRDSIIEYLKNSKEWVKNYVVDIGTLTNGDAVLVEFNDVGLSGRYVDNDFCQILEAFTGLKCDKSYKDFVTEMDN